MKKASWEEGCQLLPGLFTDAGPVALRACEKERGQVKRHHTLHP